MVTCARELVEMLTNTIPACDIQAYERYSARVKREGGLLLDYTAWKKKSPRTAIINDERKLKPCLPSAASSIQTRGYYEFDEASKEEIVTKEERCFLSELYFRSRSGWKSTKLISGKGKNYGVFSNCSTEILPPVKNINLSAVDATALLQIINAIFLDWRSRMNLSMEYKVGACEYIHYVNRSADSLYGQMTHLDAECDAIENKFGLFLPIEIPLTKSEMFSLVPEEKMNLQPVGTRIVDLPVAGGTFNFTGLSHLPPAVWKFNAPTRNLRTNFSQYASIVVNKVPHGGGLQRPFSERLTLFLYIVPLQWSSLFELNVTLPAIEFLMKSDKFDMIDIADLKTNKDIGEWLQNVRGAHEHFKGLVDDAKQKKRNLETVVQCLEKKDKEYEMQSKKRKKM